MKEAKRVKQFSCCMTDSLPANQGLSFNTKGPSCGFSMIGRGAKLTTFLPCYLLYCIAHTLHVRLHMCASVWMPIYSTVNVYTHVYVSLAVAGKDSMKIAPQSFSTSWWWTANSNLKWNIYTSNVSQQCWLAARCIQSWTSLRLLKSNHNDLVWNDWLLIHKS